MSWDPGQYLKFDDERARPGHDLINRIKSARPATIVDLGCGTGDLTAALAERWPEAAVSGVDSSSEMLAKARDNYPTLDWQLGDIADWQPTTGVDLIYSNAALHWLDDHRQLFPRLFECLSPGGVMAVQIPRMFQEPSHQLMAQAAKSGPWADRLIGPLPEWPVLTPAEYRQILLPISAAVDIWETIYCHVLSGDNPVLEWVRSTGLRPYLNALESADRPGFEAEYGARLAEAYPKEPDGVTSLPFRRLFLVAVRAP